MILVNQLVHVFGTIEQSIFEQHCSCLHEVAGNNGVGFYSRNVHKKRSGQNLPGAKKKDL